MISAESAVKIEALRYRIAAWVMRHRNAVAAAFFAMTAGFAAGLPGVDIRTVFSDLLPKDDPFVQTFRDHPNFGNPLTISVMVKRVDGDIYNADTLNKVWQLTRDIDLTPGVDHDQILSITTEKARYAEATPRGVDMRPLMDNEPPRTADEIRDFRRRVDRSPNVRVFMISGDHSATLINATFIEHRLDYGVAFDFVRAIAERADDEHHDIYLAGQPMLTGWVYRLQQQTYGIFFVTLGALTLALMLYMRNLAGIVTPIVCSLVAAVWGFGMVGWLGHPVEPLLMIVPLLLVARSFSHCVQYTERYYEVLVKVRDKRKAAEITMGIMMAPSVLGILTDVFGIVFIAVAPIDTMVRHAIFCGFWALCIIPTGIFLASILLSWLPTPRNLEHIVTQGEQAHGFHALQKRVLGRVSALSHGRLAPITSVVMLVIAVGAVYTASLIRIGNPVEGSNLLWPDSDFNTAVRAINGHFPGVNTLEIVMEAREFDLEVRVARTPGVYEISQRIQQMVENDPDLRPRATLSFSDYMKEGNRLMSGGSPKWMPLDTDAESITAAGHAVIVGTSPVNFGHIVDFEQQDSTISLWYADNKQETVDLALASARRAVEAVGVEHDLFRVRLASGFIALQQAMNEVVSRYHWFILGLVNLAVLIISTYAYRSPVAAVILLVPVNLSNFLLLATMHLLGIGLDINAVIVAVIGVGVGIDYGIYLLSRICEEFNPHGQDWGLAIHAALTTTGKAIMFTATIMLVGILPWYFLSDLKFMADMGLLLVAIMLINMLLALIVLPLLVWWIKPAFAAREDLMLGENVDLDQLASR
ncbi:efflux RND transporter permease subunit [Panacagrimonas sp.]|uniref:efflux RND transporter permease subunit n=1 Tax=Panacagrimonas sp. TaxID=2480088 RepID=UPI003B529CFA